jgi:hypothetical protein
MTDCVVVETLGRDRVHENAHADVEAGDLVITDRATEEEIDRYPKGTWLHATVFDAQGYPLYAQHGALVDFSAREQELVAAGDPRRV